MTYFPGFRLLRATVLAAIVAAALATPQVSHALGDSGPLGDIDCGQLRQPACADNPGEWGETPSRLWQSRFTELWRTRNEKDLQAFFKKKWEDHVQEMQRVRSTAEFEESFTGCDRGLREKSGICINDTRESVTVPDWSPRALRLQRELQADLPLNQLTVLGSHNSFNNISDGYGLLLTEEQLDRIKKQEYSYLDQGDMNMLLITNQLYSITDQLRMGIRSLSLDAHWNEGALRVCHAEKIQDPFQYLKLPADNFNEPLRSMSALIKLTVICSPYDRPYFQIIEELNLWLRKPENSQEVVFLELENQSEGHNKELIAPIEKHLGDLVFPKSMMPKMIDGQPPPLLPTLNQIRAHGKRVVITIAAGPEVNNDLFIPRDRMKGSPVWPQSFVKHFDGSYPDCNYKNISGFDPTYSRDPNVRIAVNEDSTFVSQFFPHLPFKDFAQNFHDPGIITNDKLKQLTDCNITSISLDQVTPEKLQSAVWSWDVDRPDFTNKKNDKDCVEMAANGRWNDVRCDESPRPFACRHKTDHASWRVTTARDKWQQGSSQCKSEFGEEFEFAVPRTGYENRKLADAAANKNVWLNLNDIAVEGVWRSAPQMSAVKLKALSKCMDDVSSKATSGTRVKLYQCHGRRNQQWILPGDGTIRSAIDPEKCLDLIASNTKDGRHIVLRTCQDDRDGQRWVVSDSYLRSAVNWNKVIDVEGGKNADGTKIQIRDYTGHRNQQWEQERVPGDL